MEIPGRLIELQQATDDTHAQLRGLDGDEYAAQWKRWRDAATASQAAVTEHAKDAELNRAALEAAVKEAVRHAPATE
ncbi:hypothetical protein AB0B12_42665 [Streptomyces sp. NPDC044780]|uniref:Uncharacterized protein n=1 Tax=Streptomyces luomodiensis TaxID=3026192 RepID=A0ABY9UVR6_9ACTN|nr:hypothetical protein [Streptomyces sp. SCA4-21]WNE95568.1 hypothetical protein PS467_09595 [Streptomyces sp. SCA4-21]